MVKERDLPDMRKDRVVTKLLQRYWRLTRGLTIGAQGAIVDAGSRFLLVRHGYRPGWHFPGGGVEKGETANEALVRELHEEAAIEIRGAPQLFGIYANFHAFPGDHVALYVVRDWHQTHVPEPNAEIAELGFFGLDALPETTTRATRQRILEILGQAARDEHW